MLRNGYQELRRNTQDHWSAGIKRLQSIFRIRYAEKTIVKNIVLDKRSVKLVHANIFIFPGARNKICTECYIEGEGNVPKSHVVPAEFVLYGPLYGETCILQCPLSTWVYTLFYKNKLYKNIEAEKPRKFKNILRIY